MNSKTSVVAKQCRLETWARQIQECNNRPTGMKIEEWCEQNGVTKANYYYRVRQVRSAFIENAARQESSSAIVPVSIGTMVQEQSMNQSYSVDISSNGFDIHVTENTSMELLASILQVVAHVK